jgi:hypothetical protein
MNKLPKELIIEIYSFDPTYRDIYSDVINSLPKLLFETNIRMINCISYELNNIKY